MAIKSLTRRKVSGLVFDRAKGGGGGLNDRAKGGGGTNRPLGGCQSPSGVSVSDMCQCHS